MYSIKNLISTNNSENVTIPKVERKLKDPVTQMPTTFLYLKNRGTYIWSNLKNAYYSTKTNTQLTQHDISSVIWDLSY